LQPRAWQLSGPRHVCPARPQFVLVSVHPRELPLLRQLRQVNHHIPSFGFPIGLKLNFG
jgi:hypothetical protein